MEIVITEYEKDDLMYAGSLSVDLITENYNGGCSFGAGEPEDNCLARDLSDAFNIENMLIAAYNAGKNNESINITKLSE